MTDARIHESILVNDRVDGLSDGAFRVFVMALSWSVSQGTDGVLPQRAFRRLHPDGVRRDLIGELVAHGFLTAKGDGYEIRNFLRYQTPAETVERQRELARIRKATQRKRDAEKELQKLGVTGDGTRDGTSDARRPPSGQQTEDSDSRQQTAVRGGTTQPPEGDPFVYAPPNGEYRGGPVNSW
jgi:hypothetical protein